MSDTFSPESLPLAIRQLFELNNYDVKGPVQIHGAEVDLVATPKSDPFGTPIYIEATVEHVDNDKYGKDVGKLAMIGELERDARRLIISSSGFSLPVRERATQSRIETLTYNELFTKFEQFGPYVRHTCEGSLGVELSELNKRYVEPHFEDTLGSEPATPFLTNWRNSNGTKKRWLIVVGEYGTGKTALSKVLQYRWLLEYQQKPASPIPFRIELRDFTRQFDARGLIHHFLDYNGLGHISIDFVLSLIRRGRVVLLLDGYDEMAQYLHARERRACLEALAELAADGAKGILTSRPNYFSESEEFQLFEVLYASMATNALIETSSARDLVERERSLDQLITAQFLDRYARALRDLSPEQTENLVRTSLTHDPAGADIVLGMLRRIFRNVEDGAAVSLSGKPVIITYLLEIVESLKITPENEQRQQLSEWQIYRLIINQLMLRDLRRSDYILPDKRRQFLMALSAFLSRRDAPAIDEADFKELVRKEFADKLRGRSSDERENEVERLYADLRGSATLTRSSDRAKPGWRFSHNSLREFLLCEEIFSRLERSDEGGDVVPISDTMRMFVATQSAEEKRKATGDLAAKWPERRLSKWVSQGFNLTWDAAVTLHSGSNDPIGSSIRAITGEGMALDGIVLERLRMSSSSSKPALLKNSTWANSELRDIDLSGANLAGANFSDSALENVKFLLANLAEACFRNCLMYGVDLTGAALDGADFSGITAGEISILLGSNAAGNERRRLDGAAAIGYLRFAGAKTEDVAPYFVFLHHPKFPIVDKIIRKFAEQPQRQRRGLEQRGAARGDTDFARDFIRYMESRGLLEERNRGEIIVVTAPGLEMCKRYVEQRILALEIVDYLGK